MKKRLALFVVLTIVLTFFAGCQTPIVADPNVLTKVSLSQETKAAVDKAVLLDCDSLGIEWDFAKLYYGTINGWIVVNNDDYDAMHAAVFWKTKVGNYEFEWGHPIKLLVFKDGEAYTLEDAYSNGWLNDDHIRQIYDYHKDLRDNYGKYLKEWLASQKETQGS